MTDKECEAQLRRGKERAECSSNGDWLWAVGEPLISDVIRHALGWYEQLISLRYGHVAMCQRLTDEKKLRTRNLAENRALRDIILNLERDLAVLRRCPPYERGVPGEWPEPRK